LIFNYIIVSFNRFDVTKLIKLAHDVEKVLFSRNLFDSHNIHMGLCLVGGEGIYLVPDCPMALEDEAFRAFAYEANPKVMLPEACSKSVKLVFGTKKGEEKHSPEMVNQWICRTLLSTLRMEITAISMRLIFDYDLDVSSKKVDIEDGIISLDESH
jgi:hypothetical protein